MLFKKVLNRIKEKIIEIMVIGKDMEELKKYSKKFAIEEADDEFESRFIEKHQSPPVDKKHLQVWINMNYRKEYNEMVKQGYNKWLSDMKRMYNLQKSLKEIKEMFEEDKEKK